jgi:hypothetical protein
MKRGRLYYHEVGEREGILCEADGESDGEPYFKISIVGREERIELRELTEEKLEELRAQIDAVLKRADNNPGGASDEQGKKRHPAGAG